MIGQFLSQDGSTPCFNTNIRTVSNVPQSHAILSILLASFEEWSIIFFSKKISNILAWLSSAVTGFLKFWTILNKFLYKELKTNVLNKSSIKENHIKL